MYCGETKCVAGANLGYKETSLAKSLGYALLYRLDSREPNEIFTKGFMPYAFMPTAFTGNLQLWEAGMEALAPQVALEMERRLRNFRTTKTLLACSEKQPSYAANALARARYRQSVYYQALQAGLGLREKEQDIGRVKAFHEKYAVRYQGLPYRVESKPVCLTPYLWGASGFSQEEESGYDFLYLCYVPYDNIFKTSRYASFSDVGNFQRKKDVRTARLVTAINEVAVARVPAMHVLAARRVKIMAMGDQDSEGYNDFHQGKLKMVLLDGQTNMPIEWKPTIMPAVNAFIRRSFNEVQSKNHAQILDDVQGNMSKTAYAYCDEEHQLYAIPRELL